MINKNSLRSVNVSTIPLSTSTSSRDAPVLTARRARVQHEVPRQFVSHACADAAVEPTVQTARDLRVSSSFDPTRPTRSRWHDAAFAARDGPITLHYLLRARGEVNAVTNLVQTWLS